VLVYLDVNSTLFISDLKTISKSFEEGISDSVLITDFMYGYLLNYAVTINDMNFVS
jgi:hypothetical protein